MRFKDVLKRHLKKTGISHDTWEEEAVQRVKWRGLLRKATSAVEEQRQQEYQLVHVRRHSAATSSSFQCYNCQRYYRSRAGMTAHTRACLRLASTKVQDSHLQLRRTAIIINPVNINFILNLTQGMFIDRIYCINHTSHLHFSQNRGENALFYVQRHCF